MCGVFLDLYVQSCGALRAIAMGCTVTTGSKEERTTTVIAKNPALSPTVVASERRVSASQAESTGEAEKASSATTLSSQLADSLTIVHFNDVYNIEEREKEPCGGAPRFKTQVDGLRELDPLVFFSGDALNPSNSKWHLARWLLRPFTEIMRGRKNNNCGLYVYHNNLLHVLYYCSQYSDAREANGASLEFNGN